MAKTPTEGGKKSAAVPPATGQADPGAVVTVSPEVYKKAKQEAVNALATYAQDKAKADKSKAAVKTAYRNAGKLGIPEDELKFIVEELNGMSDEFKANVNHMLKTYENEQPYFNFNPTTH